jgi:hypothetical protein
VGYVICVHWVHRHSSADYSALLLALRLLTAEVLRLACNDYSSNLLCYSANMVCPIEVLPTEVIACIVARLCMEDLCALMRVSKVYNAIVQRALWTVIEMHRSEYHVQAVHRVLCTELAKAHMVPQYNTGPPAQKPHHIDERAHCRSARFLATFRTGSRGHAKLRKARREELGALVRHLCLPVEIIPASTLAYEFAHFVNLEHLEISGFWDQRYDIHTSTVKAPALRKLRKLKLRGYLPEEFVWWLLKEPDHIEELELAVLDRPIGFCLDLWEDLVNPPPYSWVQNGYTENLTEEDIARLEQQEDLSHEAVAPRALACLTPDIMPRLGSLRTLYLCKPSNGCATNEDWLHFSTLSDERILEEWNGLLRATRKTLQHLILDQRAVIPESTAHESDNSTYMRVCANGPSYERFVRVVLPTLLEPEQFPCLKTVRLFGFEAHHESTDDDLDPIGDYSNRSVDVPGQIRTAMPHAEVLDYAGSRIIFWSGSGEVRSCKLDSILELHPRDGLTASKLTFCFPTRWGLHKS